MLQRANAAIDTNGQLFIRLSVPHEPHLNGWHDYTISTQVVLKVCDTCADMMMMMCNDLMCT